MQRNAVLDGILVAAAAVSVLFGLSYARGSRADESNASSEGPSGGQLSEVAPPAGSGRTVVDEPTSWGRFLVVPVLPGVSIPDPVPTLPEFGAFARNESFTGESAPSAARASGLRFVDIREEYRRDMTALGAEVQEESESGAFRSSVVYASPDQFTSIRVSAYTPTASVVVLNYPDAGVYRLELTSDVNGEPTIVVMPHEATSDPNGERRVMWSQGGAVYFVITTGAFTDQEVLDIARRISEEESRR